MIVMMVNLAIADGVVAVVPEVHGQAGNMGSQLIGPVIVMQETLAHGTEPGEKTGTGGTANRYIAVGTVETGAFCSQAVNVR